MKLLLVTNIFPPDIGGPATFIDRLGHALSELGHRVTVVCTSEQPRHQEDQQRPFRVRRIPRNNPISYHLWLRTTLAGVMATHKRCLINGLAEYAGPMAKRFGCGYLVKVVGDSAWERGRNRGLISASIDDFQSQNDLPGSLRDIQQQRQAWLAAAQGVIVPSQYLRGIVAGWGVPAERIHVVLNGVPLEEYAAEKIERAPSDELRIAFVGRLTNWKGVETLLLALAQTPGVQAEIIGDGPEWPLLRTLAEQLAVGQRVNFTGRLDATAVRARLRQVDALVLTSSYEGLSHTLLEACVLGLPCITSAVGGNPEVIRDGEEGLLVPFGDITALSAALIKLRDDRPLREQMAANALKRAQEFSFTRTVDQTRALLEQMS